MEEPGSVPKSLRGFWALIVTQFQGAFSDNAFKQLLTVFAIYAVAAGDAAKGKALSSYAMGVFILPFLLFSMYGGYFADRYSKRTVSMLVKLAEIGIMVLGAVAFYTGSFWFAAGVLGLMGVHSAFFGPTKYGIIPELVPAKRISWANGILELTTFVAIITGTQAGSLLYAGAKGNLQYPMLILATLSVLGAITSYFITRVPPRAPERQFRINFLGELWHYLKYSRRDRVLWHSVLGNTYFWFVAAVIYLNIPNHAVEVLHLDEKTMTWLLTSLSIGIGAGSFAAGYLSGGKIEYGFVPLGALLLSVFALDLYRPGLGFGHVLVSLALLGCGGGFFIVPVQALVQHRPDDHNRGGVQGMAYFLSNAGSLAAAAFFGIMTVKLGVSTSGIFLSMAILTLTVSAYLVYLLPDSLLRLALWFLGHTLYRIRTVGRDNIPEHGGAMFVCNHVSFADAVFVVASTDRHVRFIMHSDYYDRWWMRPFARIMRAIPISGSNEKALLRALREASRAVREGEVVCIFAEGEITRTGHLLPFRRGFERIMKGIDAPIIPMHLDRVWGSIFSFKGGRFIWKWPQRIPYHVTVSYGSAMPAESKAPEIRRAVQELASAAVEFRKKEMQPLHREFIIEARRHSLRFSMADGQNPHVNFGRVLMMSIVLARRLRSRWSGQEMVGLLMPPSVAGAALNIAALLGGKVPVNLNYTASQESLESAIRQCGIRTVVTARAFMDKVKITVPCETVAMEDIAGQAGFADPLLGFVTLFLPAWCLEKIVGSTKRWSLDDVATIVFSSGSTGEPKGVMLTHYNIVSEIQGIAQVMAVEPKDKILGVLPFFHSFGYTGTLWFPLIRGFGVVYHPSPMDAHKIGELVSRHAVTLMVATPAFLQGYVRRVQPAQFGSLRFVLAGAEKLPERVRIAFEDRFGIQVYEAYGTTECSPAVTINVPGFRAAGFYQVGGKRAHIGHPLPGVSVKIVDPATFEPLPVGQSGLLLVKGPNVMAGYLGKPEKTAEVMHDGWYITGDIAQIDEDGFLAVTDRLSRFSKIGGEMVPHIRVEEMLHDLAAVDEQRFAVTAVPDNSKGERLVVLHTLGEQELKTVLEKLSGCGLPNLWLPRPDAFFRVDALPVLGTGKMDLRQIRGTAEELAGAARA